MLGLAKDGKCNSVDECKCAIVNTVVFLYAAPYFANKTTPDPSEIRMLAQGSLSWRSLNHTQEHKRESKETQGRMQQYQQSSHWNAPYYKSTSRTLNIRMQDINDAYWSRTDSSRDRNKNKKDPRNRYINENNDRDKCSSGSNHNSWASGGAGSGESLVAGLSVGRGGVDGDLEGVMPSVSHLGTYRCVRPLLMVWCTYAYKTMHV